MTVCEEKVVVGDNPAIGATVAYPDKDSVRPAIVIIMGTGKLDRDGNATGYRMDIYRNLSDTFVEEGFVTVRYDKRGTNGSTGDFNSAGLSDFIDDAASVVRYAKSLPFVDPGKVIVCGHSEGAMIATLLPQDKVQYI